MRSDLISEACGRALGTLATIERDERVVSHPVGHAGGSTTVKSEPDGVAVTGKAVGGEPGWEQV